MLFEIIPIKVDKDGGLKACQIRKSRVFIPRNKFFNCLGYMKKDAI